MTKTSISIFWQKRTFKGRRCEIHTLCENSGGCQNKAECRVESADVKCDCPYGYLGDFCETGMYYVILFHLCLV